MRYLLSSILYLCSFTAIVFQSETAQASCGKSAIGTARTITLSTKNGPHYGRSHGGRQLPLRHKEIVLTFDDGPIGSKTRSVLRSLRSHCARATFFSVGRMASHNPRMIRSILRARHTIGTHTMSHHNLSRRTYRHGISEISRGFAATARAGGGRVSPFFRFPGLNQTPALRALLKRHNIATFSIDVDSKDWQGLSGAASAKYIMAQLKHRRHRGILLFHDINMNTVRGLSTVLTILKKNGYKVVHIRASRKINLAQIRKIGASGALMMSKRHKSGKRRTRVAQLGKVKTTRWKRKRRLRKRYRTQTSTSRMSRKQRQRYYRLTRLRKFKRSKRIRRSRRHIKLARLQRRTKRRYARKKPVYYKRKARTRRSRKRYKNRLRHRKVRVSKLRYRKRYYR